MYPLTVCSIVRICGQGNPSPSLDRLSGLRFSRALSRWPCNIYQTVSSRSLYEGGFLRFPFAQNTRDVDFGIVGIVRLEEVDFLQLFTESGSLCGAECRWLLVDAPIGLFVGELVDEMCMMSAVTISTGMERGRSHCAWRCWETFAVQ